MTAAGWDQFRKRRNFHWKIGLRYRFPLIEMPQVEKAYAYIVQEEQLLVFRHVDYREAGVQVPGGTLEAGETPAAGGCGKPERRPGCGAWFWKNAWDGMNE